MSIALRAGDARQQLHRPGVDAELGVGRGHRLGRLQLAEHQGAARDQGELVDRALPGAERGADLQHDAGAGQRGGGIRR